MTLAVSFLRAASSELVEASAWYEGKQRGLAFEFMAEIERCVSQAADNPLQFAIARADIRRVVARRFPYCVYFRPETQRIVVLAVFHSSRNPSDWQARSE
jgi:plasmid stabilization system protein ParE